METEAAKSHADERNATQGCWGRIISWYNKNQKVSALRSVFLFLANYCVIAVGLIVLLVFLKSQ